MSTQPPEPGRYQWPPLPILDLEQASALMAARLAEAFADLEAERLRVLASLTMGRKPQVDRWITEFQTSLAAFTTRTAYDVTQFLALHIGPRYEQAVRAVTGQPMSWTQPHTTALTALAVDTYGDFLQRSRQAERVSEAFVQAVRAAAGTELPKIAAGGRTARQAADRLEARLLDQYGIDHVTYRDGSKVSVGHYARMAARTKSAVAYNAGTLTACREAGVGFVEVFDSPECGWTSHEDPDKANGTVRSIVEAGVHVIAHPNCTRAMGPRPDVTTAAEAEAAESLQPDDQRASQQAQADARAAAVPARRPQTRAAALKRARLQAARQARARGPEQDVSDLVKRSLRERGLIPQEDPAVEAAQRVRSRAEQVEPQITADVAGFVQGAGGTMPGLGEYVDAPGDFRLKATDSMSAKIRALAVDYGGDVDEAAATISDAVRYTAQFDPEVYSKRTGQVIAELRERGYQLRVKNYWGHESNPYRGVNVAGVTPDGEKFELQFHTGQSFDVKMGEMHRLYERYRYERDPVLRRELEDLMWAQTEAIEEPPGARGIGSGT